MAKGLVFLALCLVTVVGFRVVNAEVPAIFIFGDSTADVGTNNFLSGKEFKINFPFNGIDFPHGKPTGRFSNGLNSADLIARLFGFDLSPPPFLALRNCSAAVKSKNFKGINFASGGSGVLDLTGQQTVEEDPSGALQSKKKNVVTLGEQIEQYFKFHNDLMDAKGPMGTMDFLSKSLFFISTASNDLLAYYHSETSVPKEEFLSSLASTYKTHIADLIHGGARKIGIIGVPPVGCCPSQRVFNATGGCLEGLNDLAVSFHSIIGEVMANLSSQYGIKYSLGNTFDMSINVILHPTQFNFTESAAACCGTGKLNAEGFCTPKANLCSNRDQYLFWDLFHPTQAASNLAAVTLYLGDQRFVTPINFAALAAA